MKKKIAILSSVLFLNMLMVAITYSWSRSTPLIIDHTCTDISQIPDEMIDSVKAKFRLYFAHTSHGEQLTIGLQRIESVDSTYSVAIGNKHLPTEKGAFCIFDNSEGDPEDYWNSDEYQNGIDITRQVLTNNPTVNISMFVWCIQFYQEDETYFQAYLDSMSKLEAEFPDVTFIYTTSHTQFAMDPQYNIDGLNRYLRNEQIRQYCKDNNKVLYDFGDLDSWWFNPSTQQWEHQTGVVHGHTIPLQHRQFEGDDAGHTTYESCEQKAKALWWMLAKLVGWGKTNVVPKECRKIPTKFFLNQNYPNPFNFSTSISYDLPNKCEVEVSIYNIQGQLLQTLVEGEQKAGTHIVRWNGSDKENEGLSSGIYICELKTSDSFRMAKKLLLLK